ncbi:unnamed protein product [Lampetra fluviatilis]
MERSEKRTRKEDELRSDTGRAARTDEEEGQQGAERRGHRAGEEAQWKIAERTRGQEVTEEEDESEEDEREGGRHRGGLLLVSRPRVPPPPVSRLLSHPAPASSSRGH